MALGNQTTLRICWLQISISFERNPIITGLFCRKLRFFFGSAANIAGGITCASAALKGFFESQPNEALGEGRTEVCDYYGGIKCAAQSANTWMNSGTLLSDCEGTNYHSYI